MIEGLVVAHGDLGNCLIRVVESISGSAESVSALSNQGLSTRELAERIREAEEKSSESGLCIFVDAYGGSCWQAARLGKNSDTPLVTGVNLPMLLSFIQKRKTFSLAELAKVLENDGKRGILIE